MKLLAGLVFALLAMFSVVCRAFPTENQVQLPSESIRQERQAHHGHHHDAVDFGAHTGDHGAFGWYADFPVHSH